MAKKICLDAGHYGKYNRSPAVKTYYESDMNWKLHNLLKKELKPYGFEVIQTRADQATDKSLTARGKTAAGCDLFLSIHSNAAGSEVKESVDYPIVYVPLSGAGDEIGKKLAECIAKTMGTKQKAKCRSKRGNNGDYYGVIRGAASVGVPGLILEHSFHTNTKMTNWLLDDKNLQKLAQAEAKVLADHYGMTKVVKPADKAHTVYRVQVGAFTSKGNATKKLQAVQAAGFEDAFLTHDGTWWRVQAGSFEVKANAEQRLKKVEAAGFSGFIAKATIPVK